MPHQLVVSNPHTDHLLRILIVIFLPALRSTLLDIGCMGEAQMVDVSPKETSKRVGIASCKVILGRKVYDLVSANQVTKGDVLSVAIFAGICGAKQTSNLIPLCHNINLSHVCVDLTLNPADFSVKVEAEAASTGKMGVEMEAMTAVSIAGLTVYYMCKAASKDIQITNVRLEHNTGGKSGTWSREKLLHLQNQSRNGNFSGINNNEATLWFL